jgi:hypothetical protein
MKRTTIMAPDELLQQLRRVAVERHISLAALIRESLEETAQRHRPRLRSLGIGASGYTDTSQRASDPSDDLFEPDSWR